MLSLITLTAALLWQPRVGTCGGFFDGIRPTGATECVVRHDRGGENWSTWTETRTPVRLHCAPGDTAWLPNEHTAACRRVN